MCQKGLSKGELYGKQGPEGKAWGLRKEKCFSKSRGRRSRFVRDEGRPRSEANYSVFEGLQSSSPKLVQHLDGGRVWIASSHDFL